MPRKATTQRADENANPFELVRQITQQAAEGHAEQVRIANEKTRTINDLHAARRSLWEAFDPFLSVACDPFLIAPEFPTETFVRALLKAGTVLARPEYRDGLANLERDHLARLSSILSERTARSEEQAALLKVRAASVLPAIVVLRDAASGNEKRLRSTVAKAATAKAWGAFSLATWILLWDAILGISQEPPTPDAEPTAERPALKRNACADRDHWFVARSDEGMLPAAIRNAWNRLADGERKRISPSRPDKIYDNNAGANLVAQAIRRARQKK